MTPPHQQQQQDPSLLISESEIPPNCTVLDLSHHPHQYIGISYPLPKSLEKLDLTNCRLRGVCNLEPLVKLQYLGLRKNLIGLVEEEEDDGEDTEEEDDANPNENQNQQQNATSHKQHQMQDEEDKKDSSHASAQQHHEYLGNDWAKGLTTLKNLKELDMYDNELTMIPEEINQLHQLEKLDFSFNKIRSIKTLHGEDLPHLQELYLVTNKVKKMIDFASEFQSLRILELGSNRIRTIEGLEVQQSSSTNHLTQNLKELWLGKNKISKIQGLSQLQNLKTLSLQSNRLTCITGLDKLVNLEQLLLSENDIERIEGLDNLKHLKLLDLSYNKKLSTIHGIEHLKELEEFWFSSNSVTDYEELKKLTQYPKLVDVYLQGNPLSRDPQYRRKVLLMIPDLENIDGFPVSLMKQQVLPRSGTGSE